MGDLPTVWVGLPAYNEEDGLLPLLGSLTAVRVEMREHGADLRVLVVDDGSTDATAERLGGYALENPHVIPLRHRRNRGLGAAIQTLVMEALERGREGDVLVLMDADNTHDPGAIPAMVGAMRREQADLVIASRFVAGSAEQGVCFMRRLYSRLASWVYRLLFPMGGVRDYTCGYRAYDIGFLKSAVSRQARLVTTAGFESTTELLLRLRRAGARAAEYPIRLGYDRKQGVSKLAVLRTIRGHLRLIRAMLSPRAHL